MASGNKKIKTVLKKKPKFIGVNKTPPATQRFCVNCKKMRTFKYNPTIGHSECKRCGCRYAKRKGK